MKIKFILALILVVAFLLRFISVTRIPPSLNWDEAAIGYNAYSILKTGHDEWGRFFPIHFKSYGEYKLPGQVYASIPGIAIFGLNEFGVRITPVVYGTITILLLFFLTRKLFKNDWIALGSAFLLAISPWHIQLTRASFESSFSVMWVVMGLWFLVKGFEDSKWFVWAMIPFVISVYTYNSARVFSPLFLLVAAILYRKTLFKFKKAVLLGVLLFVVLSLPLIPFLVSSDRSARYKLVSITDDPGLVPRINERRGNSNLPQPLPKLVHNKVTYVSFYFARNYLAHFSPDFLFISGAPHKQHHVQNIGELYWFQAPFLLIGLYFLIKKRNKFNGILFSWVLLTFIPVSITNDSIPHALRTAIATPFYQIVTAFGLYESYLLLKNKKIIIVGVISLSIVVLISLYYYINIYFVTYPIKYSRDWQYGYKQVVEYIKENQDKYDEVIFSRHYGEPHMFTLFYLNYPPQNYYNNPYLDREETNDWVWVHRFDKYYFPDLGDKGTQFKDIVAENPGKKLLFIGKPGDFPEGLQKLLTVNFLDGSPAFEIVEVK